MKILETELGWRYYGGKHYESIYTRWYQGYWLPLKFGYDKRRSHLSSLISAGEITRAEGIELLTSDPYPVEMQKEDTKYVMKKLGLTEGQLNEIRKLPQKSYWDYPSYGQMYHTKLFHVIKKLYHFINKNQR